MAQTPVQPAMAGATAGAGLRGGPASSTVPQIHAPHGGVSAPPAPAQENRNWFIRHKVLSSILAVLAVFVVIGALSPDSDSGSTQNASSPSATGNGAGSDQNSAASDSTSADPAPADDAPAKAAPAKPKLTQQDRFIKVIEDAAGKAEDTDNELQVVKVRHERTAQIRNLLPSLHVRNWTGTVDDVSTTLGGDSGVLTVSLTDDIKVGTWNNGLSDFEDHTLIDVDSPLYDKLADLSNGDDVTFSGKFVRDADSGIGEQSMMDISGMTTPTFTFKFTSIKKN
jgi:hypothetical protein